MKVQLFLPAVGHKGKSQHWSLIFYHYLHGPCSQPIGPTLHPYDTEQPNLLRCFVRFGLMLRNPQKSTIQVELEAPHLKLFLRYLRFHHCSGFPHFTWEDCPSFFFQPLSLGQKYGHVSGQFTSTYRNLSSLKPISHFWL